MTTVWGIHDWDGLTYSPSGCGWYRIIMPLAELGQHEGWTTGWRHGNPPQERYDIIAGQRLDKADALGAWRRLAMRSRLVYDIDDDVWNIRRSNWVAYQSFNAASRDAVAAFAGYANLVTVSTEPLAEIMRKHTDPDRVVVLPNHVPGWLLDHERPRRDKVVVGWAGGSSHAEDLGMIAAYVRRSVTAANGAAELHIVGCDFRRTFAPLRAMRHTDWIPADAGGDYYRAIDFDIALAPLIVSPFDESKSSIKALEAMALGIPVIATYCQAYRELVTDGVNGYLIRRDRKSDWGRRLRELIADPQARAEMGAKAREAARPHVIENGWRLWAAAYKELV